MKPLSLVLGFFGHILLLKYHMIIPVKGKKQVGRNSCDVWKASLVSSMGCNCAGHSAKHTVHVKPFDIFGNALR